MRDVPARNLLVQPQNQGTAPAIVYSLTRLNAAAPEAIVAFFPSDHHFANEEAFSTAVDQMFAHVELYGQHILLLGIAPESEEEGYGWIGARRALAPHFPRPCIQGTQFLGETVKEHCKGFDDEGLSLEQLCHGRTRERIP